MLKSMVHCDHALARYDCDSAIYGDVIRNFHGNSAFVLGAAFHLTIVLGTSVMSFIVNTDLILERPCLIMS